jgi:hypothetical protein
MNQNLLEGIGLAPSIGIVLFTVVIIVFLTVRASPIRVNLVIIRWDRFAHSWSSDGCAGEKLATSTPSIPPVIVTGVISRLVLSRVHF